MTVQPSADRSAELSGLQIADRLLPRPHRVERRAGSLALPAAPIVGAVGELEPPELEALASLRAAWAADGGVHVEIRHGAGAADGAHVVVALGPPGAPAVAQPVPGRNAACRAQGYRLTITPQRVELTADTGPGLFNGLQTLRQFVSAFGRVWPALELQDAPDYAVRGLSYDVSRGKVPTLDGLRELVDRLAAFKINHLQLYVEHTFAFEFEPEIWRGTTPLSAAEIRELDAECARRRIELVPSLASCGHMAGVLSVPAYRHLADVESTRHWTEMTWYQRMRGLTLDVTNPESRALLERMYAEYLPLFSAPLVNIACDETYDLGQGKNRARAGDLGRLYTGHIRWLTELAARFGKRAMFWGDIIKKYPHLLGEIPRDNIVLNWGYDPDADYSSTALFTSAGLATYVCPGCAGWNRVVNDIPTADLNIRRYAAAGLQHGAEGLLNTDWGDEGHVNLVAGSWHPFALGAAMAWNTSGPDPAAFDSAFARLLWQDAEGETIRALRAAAEVSDLPRCWPAFCAPLEQSIPEKDCSTDRLACWSELSRRAERVFAARRPADPGAAQDMRELEAACRFNALLGDRLSLGRALATNAGPTPAPLAGQLRQLADGCEELIEPYSAAWLARNKPSLLAEILAVLRRVADEARAAAEV